MLSAQPYNNKITSLPACSGHGNNMDSPCFFVVIVKYYRVERLPLLSKLKKKKKTSKYNDPKQTSQSTHSPAEHSHSCFLHTIQVLLAEVKDSLPEPWDDGLGGGGTTTSLPPPLCLKTGLCKAIRRPG